MSIEFYIGNIEIASFQENDLARLSTAQKDLQAKTGVRIDVYGTTIVAPEHARIWRRSLQALLPNLASQPEAETACRKLVSTLDEVIQQNAILRIEGE